MQTTQWGAAGRGLARTKPPDNGAGVALPAAQAGCARGGDMLTWVHTSLGVSGPTGGHLLCVPASATPFCDKSR